MSKEDFKADLGDVGINEVYDYYGMAEQVGSIYMECEKGYLHSSHFSKVIVRNPYDFGADAERNSFGTYSHAERNHGRLQTLSGYLRMGFAVCIFL